MTELEVKRPPHGRKQFIEAAGWQASTSEEYRDMPHEYTVRGRMTAGKEPPPIGWHNWFVFQIKNRGYRARFVNTNTGKGYWYTYMDFDGFKYWSMSVPKPNWHAGGMIINRERLPVPSGPTEEHP